MSLQVGDRVIARHQRLSGGWEYAGRIVTRVTNVYCWLDKRVGYSSLRFDKADVRPYDVTALEKLQALQAERQIAAERFNQVALRVRRESEELFEVHP